jgi:hypothetical protein
VALEGKAERGPLVTRIVLQVGAMPTKYYAAEPPREGSGPDLWKYVQTATLAYTSSKLTLEAGLFPSPIGPEVFAVKDNWSWSRSNLFVGLPFYHTGVRASRPLGGGWTGTVALYNGWNSVVDNNASPSLSASATYTDACTTAQLLYFGGVERDAWRHLFDAFATHKRGRVAVTAHVDGGFERDDLGTSGWYAGALAAKLDLTPKLYGALRADYFREYGADGATAIAFPVPWVASGTATLALQPTDGLSVRLEYRHDRADRDAFFGGTVTADAPNRRDQDTVTLGATAWF